tara:strand:- start:1973 stop:2902 length:930 start_codon:yes stop_codon:yes gene_type:complete
MNEKTKQHLIYGIILVVIVSSIIFYSNYNYSQLRTDYNLKIAKTENQLKNTESTLKEDITTLQTNTDTKIDLVNSDLTSYKDLNRKDIDNIRNLITQIEEQSNLQLQELKSDIKNIQIQSADFTGIIDDVLLAVVSVVTNKGLGSGAIIREDGYIVTNLHVVDGASAIRVDTYDHDRHSAELIGYDAQHDIAILKVDATLKILEFGDSDDSKVGSKVIALGNPAGLDFTVTEGIISATREFNGIGYLQTDVPINPGNSGGPLVDKRGNLIGINNFKVGGLESLGFSVTSNEVSPIADNIISNYLASQNE